MVSRHAELLRHFADLRDGTHGGRSRGDKERLLRRGRALLDPHARQALAEINTDLLLEPARVTATEFALGGWRRRCRLGIVMAEQQAAGIER